LPPFAQISPNLLRDIFELDGWKSSREDGYNWLMEKDGFDSIPIRVRTLPFSVFDSCLIKSQITGDKYQSLLSKAIGMAAQA
jgi:hypothetical protein